MTLAGNILPFGSVDGIMLGTVHFTWDGGLLGIGGRGRGRETKNKRLLRGGCPKKLKKKGREGGIGKNSEIKKWNEILTN